MIQIPSQVKVSRLAKWKERKWETLELAVLSVSQSKSEKSSSLEMIEDFS